MQRKAGEDCPLGEYLIFAREFSKLCPGFETDIHGLVEQVDDSGELRYYADCVALDDTAPAPWAAIAAPKNQNLCVRRHPAR